MANVPHGPYTPTVYTTTMTKANATNLETGPGVALHSFNPDLIGAAYVQSGAACVKDATTASQLNVTSGKAYLIMTDGTLAEIDIAASTAGQFSTVGHATATLYLDLNPDGSWSFATTHSAVTNYLPICQVTTDGSANINGVTDKRVMFASLLSGAAHTSVAQPGGLQAPAPLSVLTTQNAALAGTVNGGVTFGQVGALHGSMDGSAQFNGSTGYVNLATSGLPTGAGPWTLEAWCRFSAAPSGQQFVIALGTLATDKLASLSVLGGGAALASMYFDDTPASATLSVNVWHQLVATYDGATLKLYVDGALSGSKATALGNLTYGSASIGSFNSLFFAGSIDEVAIYASALSSTRVTAHYNAGISTTSDAYAATVLADAPLRYYRLGDAVSAATAAATSAPTASTVVDAGGAFGGALLIDTEGGQAVVRTNPTVNPLILQVNGHNTTFDASGNISGSGNVYMAIGGGPLQATGSSSASPSSDTQLASLAVPVAGVYLVWCYLNGYVINNGLAPSVTMTGYHNGSSLDASGGDHAAAGAQGASANPFSFTLAWCYKVTCAASDTLAIDWRVSSTSSSGSAKLIAQYLHP